MAGRSSRKRAEPAPRLFAREELRLRASGLAQLSRLARSGRGTLTERERRRDEDRETMRRLETWGAQLARRFRLRYLRLEPERDGINGHYGICYDDGLIRIRLRHARTGRLLKESSLVDTLCHELAHLRYMDHSLRFRRLYQRILAQARRLGYYRPGPAEDRPRQARLFDEGACGTAQRRHRA